MWSKVKMASEFGLPAAETEPTSLAAALEALKISESRLRVALNWITIFVGELPVGLKSELLRAGRTKTALPVVPVKNGKLSMENQPLCSTSSSVSQFSSIQGQEAPETESACDIDDTRPHANLKPNGNTLASTSTRLRQNSSHNFYSAGFDSKAEYRNREIRSNGSRFSKLDTKSEDSQGSNWERRKIENRARVCWRTEYNSGLLAGLTYNERVSKLDKLFDQLSESEKQKWMDYAEAKQRDYNAIAPEIEPEPKNYIQPIIKQEQSQSQYLTNGENEFRNKLGNALTHGTAWYKKLEKTERQSRVADLWKQLDESQQKEWADYAEATSRNRKLPESLKVSIPPPKLPLDIRSGTRNQQKQGPLNRKKYYTSLYY